MFKYQTEKKVPFFIPLNTSNATENEICHFTVNIMGNFHKSSFSQTLLKMLYIVTLRVGVRHSLPLTPLLLTSPFSALFSNFSMALSQAKHSRARRKRLHCRLCKALLCSFIYLLPWNAFTLFFYC